MLRDNTESARQPLDNSEADQAIDEGRRVYVGNLPYDTKVQDIVKLFADIEPGDFVVNLSIGMSVPYRIHDRAHVEYLEVESSTLGHSAGFEAGIPFLKLPHFCPQFRRGLLLELNLCYLGHSLLLCRSNI